MVDLLSLREVLPSLSGHPGTRILRVKSNHRLSDSTESRLFVVESMEGTRKSYLRVGRHQPA